MKGIILAHFGLRSGIVPYWAVTGPDEQLVRDGDWIGIQSPQGVYPEIHQRDIVWVLEAVAGGYRPVPPDRVPSMEWRP